MTRSKILIAVVVALLVIVAAVMAWNMRAPSGEPAAANPSEFTSQQGLFTLSYQVDAGEIPRNSLHAWTIHIEDAGGQPVTGAQIGIDGGMPAHGHGLPTQPQVTADLGGGDYRVEGLRFQMGGEWVVNFHIQAGGATDTAVVTFNLP